MLRTSLGTESFFDVFKRLGKPVTKENAHKLCAMACAAPEIFLAPAINCHKMYMTHDITTVWCTTRNIPSYSPYARLAASVIRPYSVEDYCNEDTLKAIFDALDDTIAKVRKVLQDDGFPDFE